MNKKAIASALALGLAGTASAQSIKGSDTLFEMTQEMINLCKVNVAPLNLSYVGGGSSLGQGEMQAGTQKIAPMSRFINSGGCSTTNTALPGTTSTRQGYAHSLDAIAIHSDNAEDTTCDVLRHSGTMTVLASANAAGDATLNCGGAAGDSSLCTNVTATQGDYNFTMWQQVLRILYAGRHETFTYNECGFEAPGAVGVQSCNSDVRHTLVNTWGNLFEGGCTDPECTQLKHAFRRDDVSGTTDTFLNLLSIKGLYAGDGTYQGLDVFCNGNEFEDKDPIRRVCTGGTFNSATGNVNAGENVCQRVTYAREVPNVGTRISSTAGTPFPQLENVWPKVTAAIVPPAATAGDLGVVLAIVMPTTLADQYPNTNICSGDFNFAPMPTPTTSDPDLERCPDGLLRKGGQCRWPIDATGQFGCLNPANFRPAAGDLQINSRMDARVYNLTTRRPNGTIPTVSRKPTPTAAAANRTFINNSYYRIHQRASLTEGGGTAFSCVEDNDTDQIGCLVRASPCSLGFAGLGAQKTDANGVPVANTNKTLDMRAPIAGGLAQSATPANIRKLLVTPAGGATGTCGTAVDNSGYGTRYPLSRKLWLNTFVGFSNLAAAGATAAEQQLAKCWSDRRFVDRAAKHAGFVTLTDNACLTAALPTDPTLPLNTPDGTGGNPDCLLDDAPTYEISSCAVNP